MPVTTIGDATVHVDAEGFLTQFEEWDERLATDLAAQIGIALSDAHWKVIRILRADYAAQGETDRLTPGRKSTVREHNIEGSPGTQIIPELYKDGDYVINNKKRLDCFYGTDLRQLLDTLKVKNVVLMGINTNTCVLNTSFTAFNFDYRVVVLADCVASMYGDDLHVLGLQNVARCLGWVITNEQLFEKLKETSNVVHA